MEIYLLIVVIYFMFFYIGIKILTKKRRIDVINGKIQEMPIIASIMFSFVPLIRLVFIIVFYYIYFCSEETIKQLKNRKEN